MLRPQPRGVDNSTNDKRRASGSFHSTPLAHLLVYALDRRLTGTLSVSAPTGDHATIVWWEGRISKAATSRSPQVNASRQGEASELVTRTLLEVFSFPSESTFLFDEGIDGLPASPAQRIDPFPALWRGVRGWPSMPHVRKVVDGAGGGSFRVVRRAEIERFRFDRDELAVIDCLRAQPMSLSALMALGVLERVRLEVLVYALLITKQVELAPLIPMTGSERPQYGSDPALGPFRRALGSIPDEPPRTSGIRAAPVPGDASPEGIDMAAVGAKTARAAAEIYLGRQDYARAERLCKRACAVEPGRPEPLALLGWIAISRSVASDVQALREALMRLEQAIALDAAYAPAYYYRGCLHKLLDSHAAALRDFKQAAALDSELTGAVREVLLYTSRIRSGAIRLDAKLTPQAALVVGAGRKSK